MKRSKSQSYCCREFIVIFNSKGKENSENEVEVENVSDVHCCNEEQQSSC